MDLEKVKATVDSTLWVEKYKPSSISEVLCDPKVKEKFKSFVDDKDIPHLLFQGSPGNGKTSCAKLIANAISENVLFINASSETGVDVVRHKIEPFCAHQSLNDDMKVVILDEMEMSSENFQTALRENIERFTSTTRFILTCNFINKVIDPLKSRTQEFKFGDIKQIDILKRCMAILEEENVQYDKKNIAKLIKGLGTDMRKIVNELQKLVYIDGDVKRLEDYTSLEEKQLLLLELIKSKKLTDVRKFIGDHNLNADEIMKFLFNKSFEKDLGSRWVEQLAQLAEGSYRLKLGVDPEITVMNTICEVMQLIER